MLYGYLLVFGLTAALVGYAIGRRVGIRDGFKKGVVYSPIVLKASYMEENRCPICTTTKK